MSSWNGPRALGTLCCSETQATSTHELIRDQHPSLLPHETRLGRHSGAAQEFRTLRNSHTFLLPFGLPQTGHSPGELQLPDLSPAASCTSWESQSTECFFFPARAGSPDSCPCCKTWLENWQGQSTAPARHRSSREHPGHPHLPPGSQKSPPRWEQGVLMELTGAPGR